jgi:hypothetical protein
LEDFGQIRFFHPTHTVNANWGGGGGGGGGGVAVVGVLIRTESVTAVSFINVVG